jgi:hypothetical protein
LDEHDMADPDVEGLAFAPKQPRNHIKAQPKTRNTMKKAALLSILAAAPLANAQSCISLADSQACKAFSSAAVSTDPGVVGLLCVLPSLFPRAHHFELTSNSDTMIALAMLQH